MLLLPECQFCNFNRGNKVPRASWLVERRFSDKPTFLIIHMECATHLFLIPL